jgi:hypothetical protein
VPDDYVSDEEELYRSVRGTLRDEEYYYDEYDRRLIITQNAFRDRDREPSVDRAKLKNFDPLQSKFSETDGIVTLVTKNVRGIGDVVTNTEGGAKVEHAVDVKPDPKDDNEAHSLIVVTPDFFGSNNKQKNVFKLLRISLARLATEKGWTVPPSTSS